MTEIIVVPLTLAVVNTIKGMLPKRLYKKVLPIVSLLVGVASVLLLEMVETFMSPTFVYVFYGVLVGLTSSACYDLYADNIKYNNRR